MVKTVGSRACFAEMKFSFYTSGSAKSFMGLPAAKPHPPSLSCAPHMWRPGFVKSLILFWKGSHGNQVCVSYGRFEELVKKFKVEYHAGGATQNSIKIAQVSHTHAHTHTNLCRRTVNVDFSSQLSHLMMMFLSVVDDPRTP